jgi:hypothetical protein
MAETQNLGTASVSVRADLSQLPGDLAAAKSTINSFIDDVSSLFAGMGGKVSQSLNIGQAIQEAIGQLAQLKGAVDDVATSFGNITSAASSAATGTQGVGDAAKTATGGTDSLGISMGTLRQVAGALGFTATIAGLVELYRTSIDTGASILRLSTATGIGVEELQKLGNAAALFDIPLDTLARSIDRMQKLVETDSVSVQKALKDLGMSVTDLDTMGPEKFFVQMSQGLSEMANHSQAVTDATSLMGRITPDMLALVLSNVQKLGTGMETLSEDELHSLDVAHTAWVTFVVDSEVLGGRLVSLYSKISGSIEVLASVVHASQLGQSFDEGASDIGNAIGMLDAFLGVLMNTATQTPKVAGALNLLPPAFASTVMSMDEAEKESEKWRAEVEAHIKKVQELADTYSGVKIAQQVEDLTYAVIQMGGATKVSAAELPALIKQLEAWKAAGIAIGPVLQSIIDLNPTLTKAWKEQEDDLKTLSKSYGDFEEQFSGIKIQNSIEAQTIALETLRTAGIQPLRGQIDLLIQDSTKWVEQGADVSGIVEQIAAALKDQQDKGQLSNTTIKDTIALWRALYEAGQPIPDEIENIALQYSFFGVKIDTTGEAIKKLIKNGQDLTREFKAWGDAFLKPTQDWDKNLNLVIGDFRSLASTTSGEMSQIASDIAKGVSATKTFGDSIKSISAGGFLNMLSGITGIAGAAITLGSALAHAFGIGSTAGRDLVTQFAQSQGGFDALHAKLLAAGDDGERFWRMLSGVGEGNAAQANSVIAQVTKYLNDADAAAQRLAQRQTDMAQTQQELNADIEKYHITIQQLGPAFKQQKLTEQAEDLIGSYTRLTDAGVQTNDVITAMSGIVTDADGKVTGFSGGLNQLLNDAIATGAALPDQFKPILQTMIDNGEAVDATGQKIKDLSGVKFSQSLDQQFDTLIGKINDLINAILQGLYPALDGIAGRAGTIGPAPGGGGGPVEEPPPGRPGSPGTPNQPTNPNQPPPLPGPNDSPGPIPLAAGGIITTPTFALVGESGPEAVVPIPVYNAMLDGANQQQGGNSYSVQQIFAPTVRSWDSNDVLDAMPDIIRQFTNVMATGGSMSTDFVNRVVVNVLRSRGVSIT